MTLGRLLILICKEGVATVPAPGLSDLIHVKSLTRCPIQDGYSVSGVSYQFKISSLCSGMGHLLLCPTCRTMSSLKAGTSLFLPWHLQLWGTMEHEYLLNELLNDSGWMLCEKRSDPKVGKMRFNPDGTGASLRWGKGNAGTFPCRAGSKELRLPTNCW